MLQNLYLTKKRQSSDHIHGLTLNSSQLNIINISLRLSNENSELHREDVA